MTVTGSALAPKAKLGVGGTRGGAVFRLWPWAAALASGALLTLCFPPWNFEWACWIALAPLLCAVWMSPGGKRPWFRYASLGYLSGLIFFWSVFGWLTTVTGLGWFLLAFYLAFYLAFWAWFAGSVVCPEERVPPGSPPDARPGLLSSRRNLWIAFAGASAWVLQEAARGVVFSGFPWNNLGAALHREIALIQIADITGVAGLSFLVAFCNLMLVLTLWRIAREIGTVRLRPHYDFSLTMILIVAILFYGFMKRQRAFPGRTLTVVSVQANIPQNEKFDPAFEQRIFDRYRALTEGAAAFRPDLILWPESATPRALFGDEVNYNFVREMASLGRSDLLFGTLDFDNDNHDFNVAALLRHGDETPSIYQKIHLVPFGEYIPFRHSFPLFAIVAGDLVPGDFTPGTEHTVLRLSEPSIGIAPLICFEDTLGDLARRFVLNGADVLINLTNDGWFLKSAAAEQHFANSVFRAIENRRPLLRSSNTGVTAFMDANGTLTAGEAWEFVDASEIAAGPARGMHKQELKRIPSGGWLRKLPSTAAILLNREARPFFPGVLVGRIQAPEHGPVTFFTRYGEVFSIALSVVAGLAVVLHFVHGKKR